MRLGHILNAIRRKDDSLPVVSNGRPIVFIDTSQEDRVYLATEKGDYGFTVGELRERLEPYPAYLPVWVGEGRVKEVQRSLHPDPEISLFAPWPKRMLGE